MFTKIREAYRILSYREDSRHAPDIIIVEQPAKKVLPKTSLRIAKFLEFVAFVGIGSACSAVVGTALYRIEHPKVASLATVVAVFSMLAAYMAHTVSEKFQDKLQKSFRLSERLAPFFGNKLNSAISTLRGAKLDA